MALRPFPEKSRYHSQEFIGGPITSLDQGYLVAYVDGDARGHPGPAGYGVVIEDEVGRPVAQLSEFLGSQTNHHAGYSGLLAALNYALRHGFKALKLVSDSEQIVQEIRGERKVRSAPLNELHARAMLLIDQLEFVELTYLSREKNREADKLANVVIDRGIARKAPVVSATDVGGVASVVPELNGIVRDGVIHFTGGPLPDGTSVKIRAVKP